MKNECQVCKIEFESLKPAKTCSPKCRVTLARLRVTDAPKDVLHVDSVTPNVTPKFKFTVTYNKKPGDTGYDEDTARQRARVREAIYWYDVPLAAVPVIQEGWPEMPELMNGRQYFLWWKNDFKTQGKKDYAGYGQPTIHNPFPEKTGDVVYLNAGEGSRRWGTT